MAASGEPRTILTPRLIRCIQEMTGHGELYSASAIVRDLMLCAEATTPMRIDALKGQAELAKKRGNRAWCATAAKSAEALQFHSTQWIEHHLSSVSRNQRTPSAMPAGPSRDIRLDTDPSIERHVEDAAEEVMEVEVSPEEEERLLREDSPTIMEFDISSVPGPDISGCPTVKRQVVQRPPAPCSSIVAEQDGPKRRSPVRFPSQEDTPPSGRTRERSPRKGERKYRQRPSPEKRSSPVRKPRSRSPRKREQRDRRRLSPGRRSSPVRKPRSRSPRKAVVKRRQSPRSADRKRVRHSPAPRHNSPSRQVQRRSPVGGHAARDRNRHRDAGRSIGSAAAVSPRPMAGAGNRSTSGRRDHSTGVLRKSAADRADRCPVLNCGESVSRTHAATHLPGIFNDQLEPTEELQRQRISVLRICESRLLGSVTNLAGLVQYVSDLRQIQRGHYTVSIQQARALTSMCEIQGYEVPEGFNIEPANSPAVLLHWRVLLVVFACLNDPDRQELIDRYPISSEWIEDTLPEAIDSHFHLDRARSMLRSPGASVDDLCKSIQSDREYRVRLTGGVVIFCDPQTYPTQEEMQHLKSQGYAIALGLHPKGTNHYSEQDFETFRRLVNQPEVTVLGEVGLDYTADPSTWGRQHVILDRVLKHLQPSQVLVLHARGAYYQLLFQLKGTIPSEQRIHLHCFEGSQQLLADWIGEFPNTYFGFTGLVQHFNEAKKQALRSLPESRLLVETDSPYFKIGGRRHSSPALVGMVAKMVADVRGCTWKEVLQVSSSNARSLYHL